MFTKEALKALEVVLIREKATALSEKHDTARLFGAYGDKRASISDRYTVASDRYEVADSLLTLVRKELDDVR